MVASLLSAGQGAIEPLGGEEIIAEQIIAEQIIAGYC